MVGAVIIVIVLVALFPVAFLMAGAAGAALLGWAAKDDAERRHAGSELIDLNR